MGCINKNVLCFLGYTRCELLLMAYKRSVEEDEKLLESVPNLTTKHILTLCICEKKLLKYSSQYCRDKIHCNSHNK